MNWGDERAQALQVGAVLLLGIAVIGLSIYQVTVVPQENRKVEFNSYLDASTDMTDLRNDVLASAQRGVQSGTTVTTGTTYPARALFVNPPPAGGRLDALEPRDVTVEGVVAVDNGGDEQRVVGAVWNGSPRDYSTRAIRFRPGYNRLNTSSVVVDGGSVYRATENGPIPIAGQSLVDGNRITLVTVGGNLSAGGLASTVTTEPVSTVERTVTVTGDGSEFTVTLRFASAADAAAWNASRVAADYRDQPRVLRTEHPTGTNTVDVVLDGTETYELRLARVTVHEANEEFVGGEPDPEYVFPYAGNESTVVNNSAVTLTAEVRDRYNNPVTGTNVTFTSPNGTFAVSGTDTRSVTTTADGRATVSFTPNATGTVNVTASFATPTSFNTTRFELDVTRLGDGGTGGNINPNEPDAVVLQGATINSSNSSAVDATFETRGSNSRNITEFRVNFYSEARQGQGTAQDANFQEYDVDNFDGAGESLDDIAIGAAFTDPTPSYVIQASGTTTIRFGFGDGTDAVQDGDFFIFSVIFENGETSTYFIAPT